MASYVASKLDNCIWNAFFDVNITENNYTLTAPIIQEQPHYQSMIDVRILHTPTKTYTIVGVY